MHTLRFSILATVSMLVLSSTGLAQPIQEESLQSLLDDDDLMKLPDGPTSQVDCAPPCGYIWPRIGVHAELPSPYPISQVRDFPTQTEITLTYSWDLEQEGTGISDPTHEMQIMIVVTRTPPFMTASLDAHTCTFMLLPVITEYEVCTLTLTTQLKEEHLPSDEEELRETGHRLMLFAASEESGTFMKSYGLEDVRFRFDHLPDEQPLPTGDDASVDANEAALPWLLLFGLVAGILAVARRTRRE